MDKTNGKSESPEKKIWIPLSSGSLVMLSWTVMAFAGVFGFKLGALVFTHAPHEFETGSFTGASVGLLVIVIAVVAIANYGFWRIYKLGRS